MRKLTPGRRFLCTAAMALAVATMSAPSLADSVNTDTDNGYGRILFTLDPAAEAKVAMAGGVLTITFDRKPAINPNIIVQGLSAYIGSARVDPGGLVYRFALAQNARLHTSTSGDRVAVDLIPDGFSGVPADLPPPPPKEVPSVDVAKLDTLKVHAGAYANYSRLVFDWPRKVSYAVFHGDGHLTIRFEAMMRPDFSGLENVSPPWVKEAGWRIENKGTVIEFGTDSQSDYRDSRDGTKIVLDILAPKGDAAPKGNQQPSVAQQDHATTPSALGPQAKAVADAVAQLKGDAKPVQPAPAATTDTAQTAKPPAPATTPAANAAPAAPTAAPPPADMAQGIRTRQGVAISFPGAGSTPAAAFIRGMTAWVVIDGSPKIDPVQVKTVLGDFASSVEESSGNGVTVVRFGLKQAEEISATANGSNLRVAIAPHITQTPEAIDFVRNDDDPKHTKLTTLIPGATHAIPLTDAAAGDNLIVVPGVTGRGVADARYYAEFAILPTAAGLVVEPYTDDLTAAVADGHVTIARPGGLAMTSAPSMSAQSPSGLVRTGDSASFLDLGHWSSTQGDSFIVAERKLRANTASQRSEDANHARLALARFYLGNEFAAEALGLLDLIQSSDPSLQGDMQLQTMRAAADYMMGRYHDAHNDLGASAFDNDRHAALWRGMIEAGLENWDGARKALALAEPVIRRYPPDWQAHARLAEANAALAENAVETADSALDHLPHNISPELAQEAQLARARLYANEGRTHDAHAIFSALISGTNEQIAAQSIFDNTEVGLSDGSVTRDQAITALDQLRFRWRGDALELRTLRKLGALYFEEKRWREGLLILRVASLSFPNEELARQAQDDMRTTFVNLFLKGKADKMPPIQALSLFYDFIDLTPIGPDGDEMIRRMSDRLVTVDLLGPAETLMNYQVTKRLDGIARAQVATRLAMIDLMDHKPKDALASLRATEMAGLPDDVNHARMLLEARSLAALKQWDQSLDLVAVDESPDTRQLRADIYWESGNWPAAGQKAEELVGDRWKDTTPLTADERRELMRAAIAYSLANDEASLDRLRTHFSGKMNASTDASAFTVVTQNIDLQGVAFRDLAGKIASVDTLETFMQDFKKRLDGARPMN
jgi:tetratricopeptide (TPR) repeat protein